MGDLELAACLVPLRVHYAISLAAIVASPSPDELTHETVAELADIPVGYLRWRYPRAKDLAAVTSASARRAS